MEQWIVIVLLLVFAEAIEARITFPGQLDHAEGDDCTTSSGGPGICSRSCGPATSQEPLRCGITFSSFLVCCETNKDKPVVDVVVPPPFVTYDCSKSKPQFLPGHQVSINSEGKTWPWMALVGRSVKGDIQWGCTGMLINAHWVLSSAFCSFDEATTVVRLGEYDFKDDFDGAHPQDFSVSKLVVHPDYTFRQGYHTIMLIQLEKRVKFQRFISPACLPWGEESRNDITGRKALILSFANGFGSNENTAQKEIEVTVFPIAQCERNYSALPTYSTSWPRGMKEETLCAGDRAGGKDACKGDAGGPLMTVDASGQYIAGGIVSAGHGCGNKDFPGLYVNLRYSPYLLWIKKVAFSKS